MPSKFCEYTPSKPSKTARVLERNLEKNLLAYTAVAGASLLSAAIPVDAQIVYTPSNIPMAQGFAGSSVTPLDLDNDGAADFNFNNFSYSTHGLGGFYLRISAAQEGNEIDGYQGAHNILASALPGGVQIGSKANFLLAPNGQFLGNEEHGTQSGSFSGGWLKVETAYLGLKFLIDGQVHYGWALIKLTGPGAFLNGSIYGYAYESTPNQPIVTGQTTGTAKVEEPVAAVPLMNNPSLGMLAAGTPGLRLWRGTANQTASNPSLQAEQK